MRFDADKLIEAILSPSKLNGVQIILCDMTILKRLIEERFQKKGLPTKHFEGKGAILDFVEDVGSGSLFGEASGSIVELSPKLTEKQWKQELEQLARIGKYDGFDAFLLGPTPLRHSIKETKDIPPLALAYPPSDPELMRACQILQARFPALKGKDLATQAIEQYGQDLISIDLHFDRMQKSGDAKFESATLMQTDVNGFSVVDALVKRDKGLVDLRLTQCENAGEDAGSVFMAVIYFLRQLSLVKAGIAKYGGLKQTFDALRIPFPSQPRLQHAVKVFKDDELLRFFVGAPLLELSLRRENEPYRLLGVELWSLIS